MTVIAVPKGAVRGVSEAQLRYLDSLLAPARLETLSSAEARFLIGWLRGPPKNMTRGQQLYLADLVGGLTPTAVHALVGQLRDASAAEFPGTENHNSTATAPCERPK